MHRALFPEQAENASRETESQYEASKESG